MSASSSPLAGLFEDAKAQFEALRSELLGYGLAIAPNVELRDGQGLLCYYDLEDGHIHLSLPDPSKPIGVFQAAMFKSMLACEDDEELATLVRLLLPSLLAHELGHYFRHQRGLFGEDLWFEEQVANQFASAVTEHRLAPNDRERLMHMMRRTLSHLAPKVDSEHIATASFLDPLQALGASGLLGHQTVRALEVLQGLFTVQPEQILRTTPKMPKEVVDRLEQRQGTIEGFNETYASGLARYVYFQFGWMLIELETPEHHYVDEVARRHLGMGSPLLPEITRANRPTREEIVQCYRAHQMLARSSGTASRYFFKRYRSLLLDRIAASQASNLGIARRLDIDARRVLEGQDDEDRHILDFLAALATPDDRELFPAALSDTSPKSTMSTALSIAAAMQCETDERLYRHLIEGIDDEAAAATLARLEQLDASEVYRALPAELLVKIAHQLYRVRLPAGETLIWQGSMNDDVFILTSGQLEVLIGPELRRVSAIAPGEVVGDMAFVTGEPRSATLRATADAECLVLRSASLRVLAYEHPALLMRLARVLARRLDAAMSS